MAARKIIMAVRLVKMPLMLRDDRHFSHNRPLSSEAIGEHQDISIRSSFSKHHLYVPVQRAQLKHLTVAGRAAALTRAILTAMLFRLTQTTKLNPIPDSSVQNLIVRHLNLLPRSMFDISEYHYAS